MADADQQLKVEVEADLLKISIGVDLLCHAVTHGPGMMSEAEVTDRDAFVRAIVDELLRDEEDGTTPVHRMFDAAAEEAVEQGAEGVRFPGDGL